MMKRLLVGLDGSPRQDDVLATAIELANVSGGRLTLLRAVGLPTGLPSSAFAVHPDEVGPLLLDSARGEFEKMVKRVPVPLLDNAHVELGTPWRTLVEYAKSMSADLIVIGSHGFGGIDHVLGTTAAKVVDHASCSVLVVRPR